MSAWFDILNAVNSAVSSVAGVDPVLRKDDQWIEGIDSVPMWMICPAGPEVVLDYVMPNTVLMNYPVAVLYLEAQNRDFTITPAQLATRESVRQSLANVTISGAANVFDSEVQNLPLYPYKEAPNTVYDASGFIVTFTNEETRSA